MGNRFSGSSVASAGGNSESSPATSQVQKRPFIEEDQDAGAPSKKRKRCKSTSQYIYKALFMSGEGSDIVVEAFGHEWKLHKVYLKQAQFFSKMFDGKWKESDDKVIQLTIPDPNVNQEALDSAFGSLYTDDIEVSPKEAESILAAASLIQLEGLMQICAEVMKESVCCDNVWTYYESARRYGQNSVERTCVEWLENNLMVQSMKGNNMNIDPALMCRILSSPSMFVVQVEMDVYTMLRKWLYLRIKAKDEDRQAGGDCGNPEPKQIQKFFREHCVRTGKAYLEVPEGEQYVEVFRAVRFCNIIRDFGCCREIEMDSIVPAKWLMPVYRERWQHMLKVEQGTDRGPAEFDCLDSKSLRCGRQILRDDDHCWRWNGYNFGMDLLISYRSEAPRLLMLKRNVESHHCVSSVSLLSKRTIIYNLRVFSLNEKGHVITAFNTGMRFQHFAKDEERIILTLGDQDLKLSFPLMISATFKTISDSQDLPANSSKAKPSSSSRNGRTQP